ncbi:hypothetical protein GCM10009687_22700 [Asanoa iriomotensis]
MAGVRARRARFRAVPGFGPCPVSGRARFRAVPGFGPCCACYYGPCPGVGRSTPAGLEMVAPDADREFPAGLRPRVPAMAMRSGHTD